MLLKKEKKFSLNDLFLDSPSLHENTFPQTRSQHKNIVRDPILQLIEKDPYEVLGFNRFSQPGDGSEKTVGTPIQEFYRGVNVFITGGTGFLGKILIEKLVRCVPHIGKIYILIRPKKGMSSSERGKELLQDTVFLRMKTEVPEYRSKLTFVDGDISEPKLGLSEEDRQTLQSQVHIVFHSAADVRFVNSLRNAVNSNVLGSKRVMDLAKGMRKLRSYVHVSTAFSNCVRKVIEEKCYGLSIDLLEVLQLLEEMSDDEISSEESRIIQGWPNAYTFSKALCEDMIYKEAKGLPICIFRPSIVWMTYKEPLRGWTDNVYGPTGMLMLIGLGLFHTSNIEVSTSIDAVPADFTVNAMIAIAWENATNRINTMPVYNFTSSPRILVTWRLIEVLGRRYLDAYPLQQAIWYPFFIPTTSSSLETVFDFFLHKVPSVIADKIAVARGQQPRLTKVYNKMSILKEKLNYFLFTTWDFKNENISLLLTKLTEEDKKLFYFDIAEMNNLPEFFLLGRLGLKYFYLKESLETMPDAERKLSWLKLAHRSLQAVSGLAALKLMVTLARVLPI